MKKDIFEQKTKPGHRGRLRPPAERRTEKPSPGRKTKPLTLRNVILKVLVPGDKFSFIPKKQS